MSTFFANDPEMIERIINGVRNALTAQPGEYVSKFTASPDEVGVTFALHKSADERAINIFNIPNGATGQSLDAAYSQAALSQAAARKLNGLP